MINGTSLMGFLVIALLYVKSGRYQNHIWDHISEIKFRSEVAVANFTNKNYDLQKFFPTQSQNLNVKTETREPKGNHIFSMKR